MSLTDTMASIPNKRDLVLSTTSKRPIVIAGHEDAFSSLREIFGRMVTEGSEKSRDSSGLPAGGAGKL
jgi:hypothetical protein